MNFPMLGTLLLDHQKISREQLENVLRNQQTFSGKMGTHLLEMGYVSVGELEDILASKFGVEAARNEDLEYLDGFCRFQFPVENLIDHQALPFRYNGSVLSVAMTDPANFAALKWLQAVSQASLKIYFVSESKFFYYFFKHFHRDIDLRIRNVFFSYMKNRAKHSAKQIDTDRSQSAFSALNETRRIAFETDAGELAAMGLKPLELGEEFTQDGEEFLLLTNVVEAQIAAAQSPETEKTPPPPVEEFLEFADPRNF